MTTGPSTYEVHYHPPQYPDRCFPGRCRHEPQFKMQANVEIIRNKRGGNTVEIDHMVCLACGKSLPATYGGNVLVDIEMLLADEGQRHWRIGQRLLFLRAKWARLATYLFDERGWNGRHEKIARQIDPHLTMKLRLDPAGRPGLRMGLIRFDPSYLRPEACT